MAFITSVVVGLFATFVGTSILVAIGRIFQLWRVLPERTVIVYTFFGKVVGQVEEPGLFFPIVHFGPKALLFPFFGKAYVVRTAFHQAYLRNQLVNSEEGAPMGVGIWFEMFVGNPKAYLFQNSDPLGSLKANVATAFSPAWRMAAVTWRRRFTTLRWISLIMPASRKATLRM